jgi:hypothetical protein
VADIRNIVVIMVDTMRAPTTTFPATDSPVMPFFQSLHTSGTLLPRFLASSSWTLPSHQALLCGDEPWKTSLEVIPSKSQRRRATLSRIWAQAGGESFAVSQNPIVNVGGGLLQGFDRAYPDARMGIQRLVLMAENHLDKWVSTPGTSKLTGRDSASPLTSAKRALVGSAERAVRPFAEGLSWSSVRLRRIDRSLLRLKRFLRSARPGRPLFIFLNVMEAHEPYFVDSGTINGSRELSPAPTNSLAAHSPNIVSSPVVGREVRQGYLNGLRAADFALEKAFSFLSRQIDMTRTLVVVASDHGQALGEHGYYGHGSYLHDELVHVPCLVWGKPPEIRTVSQALGENWVDHTHVHDFLTKIMADGIELPTSREVHELLRSRGTATSFVRARSNPDRAGPTATGTVSRIRLESGTSYAIVEGSGGKATVVESAGSDASSLGEKAVSAIYRISGTYFGGGDPSEESVEERLASWGYS